MTLNTFIYPFFLNDCRKECRKIQILARKSLKAIQTSHPPIDIMNSNPQILAWNLLYFVNVGFLLAQNFTLLYKEMHTVLDKFNIIKLILKKFPYTFISICIVFPMQKLYSTIYFDNNDICCTITKTSAKLNFDENNKRTRELMQF